MSFRFKAIYAVLMVLAFAASLYFLGTREPEEPTAIDRIVACIEANPDSMPAASECMEDIEYCTGFSTWEGEEACIWETLTIAMDRADI